jgi:hypothetical protein
MMRTIQLRPIQKMLRRLQRGEKIWMSALVPLFDVNLRPQSEQKSTNLATMKRRKRRTRKMKRKRRRKKKKKKTLTRR